MTNAELTELIRSLVENGDQWIGPKAVATIVRRGIKWTKREMRAGTFGPVHEPTSRRFRVFQPTVIAWANRCRREEYSVPVAAEVICRSERTVWRLIKAGVLEERRHGGDVQVTQASVHAYRDSLRSCHKQASSVAFSELQEEHAVSERRNEQ